MSAIRSAPPSPEAAANLSRIVFRLRRALSQSGGASLPFARLEVLRQVHRSPGLRVQDVAQALGIAPNTASTLVKQVAEMGLVERRPDPADARVVRLYPTALALARKASRHDRRDAELSAALQRLTRDERLQIEAALPVLARLLEALERRD